MAKGIPNNLITVLAVLALLLGMGLVQAKAGPAFAEEEAALDVYVDDICKASFTMEQLEQIATDEGNKQYTYSSFNTYPTALKVEMAEGPTVEAILRHALGADPSGVISDGQTITFTASDGVEEAFLKEQLFTDRYYFPNYEKVVEKTGNTIVGYRGKAVEEVSMENGEPVPAIISLKELGGGTQDRYGENGNYDVGRLLFGQVSPTEQNRAAFVKLMATGNYPEAKKRFRGRITVWSLEERPTEAWNALTETDQGPGSGEPVFTGDQVTFDRSVNRSHREGGSRYWIHYTLDGSDPGRTAEMYNYNNNSFGTASEKINKPQVSGPGEMKIKAIVTGYGKRDSEVTTFVYRGYDPVDVTISGSSDSVVYDGEIHTLAGFDFECQEGQAEVEVLSPDKLQTQGVDAGEYPMGLTESDFNVVLKQDSSEKRARVKVNDGVLKIEKAPLKVVTYSEKKSFDGKALKAAGEIIGLAADEIVSLKITGSQEEIGSSRNTYELLWDGTAKPENYEVTEQIGTLTVTKPTLAKPVMKKPGLKGTAITIKWGKVSGASGYEVFRAAKKNGKYTNVKTIKNGKTVSYKNNKLKKGKTYYYKVRAYKKVGERMFYSSYSAVKYKKVK